MPQVELSAELRTLQAASRPTVADYSYAAEASEKKSRKSFFRSAGGSSSEPPTPRTQFVSIAATMLVSFVAAFSLMYTPRPPENLGTTQPAAQATSRPFAPMPPAVRTPAQPVAATEHSAGASSVRDSVTSADPALPVKVSFVQYNRPSGGDDPEATVSVVNGRIWNQSADPLTVDVALTSGGRITAQTQVTTNPRRAAVFGQGDGLQLHSGDTVTLRNPHFADLEVRVN
jgi:hypothetical protein